MKKLLGIIITVCILCSAALSFDITASAATFKGTSVTSITNIASGIKVNWKKVSSVKQYKLLRKAPGAKSFKLYKSFSNKTATYTDKSVIAGKAYSYKIAASNGKKTVTSKAKSIVRMKAPAKLTSNLLYNSKEEENYVQLTWGKVAGAKKYEIYRGLSGKYKKVGTTVATKFNHYYDDFSTDYNMKTLCYKVVAVNGISKSAPSAIKQQKIIESPFVSALSLIDGVNVIWENENPKGLTSIFVYRAVNNGQYVKYKAFAPSKTSFLDTDVKEGNTYKYYVIVKSGNYSSPKSPVASIKHAPHSTINVKVGETSDKFIEDLTEEAKELIGNDKDLLDMLMKQVKSSLKIKIQDESIATVSSDFKITGVKEGTTKASINIKDYTNTYTESAYILINVTPAE